MYDIEEAFRRWQRRVGWDKALAGFGDVPDVAALPGPSLARTRQPPQLPDAPCVLDLNAHFIELSGPGTPAQREEALVGMCFAAFFGLLGLVLAVSLPWLWRDRSGPADKHLLVMLLFTGLAVGSLLVATVTAWSCRTALFTQLRSRYRFNRDTGQVHVLRPKRYGGNVVLDWQRARAHVDWAPVPRSRAQIERDAQVQEDLDYHRRHTNHGRDADAGDAISLLFTGLRMLETEEMDTSEAARQARRRHAPTTGHLLLVWPVQTPDELAAAKARDARRSRPFAQACSPDAAVLWLGPPGQAKAMWAYLCQYMLAGMDAVGEVGEPDWLPKGRDPELGLLLRWAERSCRWPTFPPEWRSDGGQTRRESGRGPEAPVRWSPVW